MQFKIYKDKEGSFRWKLLAANNRIVADSGEGYTRREDVYRAVGSLQTSVLTARIVDA
jgi:uncharacterized protein YegP (UPF0339 family)